jgi:hypothetical protein
MSEPDFSVSLGGGLYMDSNGDVHRGPLPVIPIYPMPGGGLLPITRESFEKALTGTTKALQGTVKVLSDFKDPDSDIFKKLTELGVSTNFLNLLGTLGGVAAKFAKVIPIIGAVVVVLEEFVKFFSSTGPSELEVMIKAQFAEMHTHIDAVAMQGKLRDIDFDRIEISKALTELNEYMETITKFQPTLVALQQARAEIGAKQDAAAKAVERLLSYNIWLLAYNPGSFQGVWPWVGDLLHLMPAGSPPPPPSRAPALPPHTNRFEHGMMVPSVIHAVQSYLLVNKTLTPEFRSTGIHDVELRKFTVLLETLTNAMRAETLARTIYPVGPDFLGRLVDPVPWHPEEVIDVPGLPPVLSPLYARFPVGALDLCAHTDAFFMQRRQAAIAAGAGDPYFDGPPTLGNMNVRWMPPAKLERFEANIPQPSTASGWTTETRYRITNLQECAAAANAQSEVDYAYLLLSSGYLNLVQLTTLMRHLATEPDRSETVKGDVISLRAPQPATDVTVKSADIPFTGVIQSSARREPARCRAIVPLSTQPLRELRMLPYRVVLRTLRSFGSPGLWHGPDYGDYYSTRYEKDPANAGFLRLVTEVNAPSVLGEYELWPKDLAAGTYGSSPRELVQVNDEWATLTAHTFDWYVPVEPSFLDDDHLADTLVALRSAGWSGAKRPPIPHKTLKGNALQTSTLTFADKVAIVGSHLWRDGTQDWEGQRREMAESTITIKYSLHWKADRLRISLEGRPQDRNYVVFLVVEETFPARGTVLHTALPVPMNGQLTYVPRKFFDAESAAIDKANRIILDVSSRYAESAPIGPEDPFIGNIRPGDLYSTVGLQRLADLAKQHQPALLRQAVQKYQASSGSVKGDVPTMTDLRSLTILRLMRHLLAHIDRGDVVAPNEIKQAVAQGTVFQLLRKRFRDFPEFSPIHEADSVLLQNELRSTLDTVAGRKEFKLGVENNGLCFLVAYCLEMLAHPNIKEITR